MANQQPVRPHKRQAALVGLAAEVAGFSAEFNRRPPHKDKSAPLAALLPLGACSSPKDSNLKIKIELKARSARVFKERLVRALAAPDFSGKVK